MLILNNTSFPVITFAQHEDFGMGPAILLEPGQTTRLLGPLVSHDAETGNNTYLKYSGEIICEENEEEADDQDIFLVGLGNPVTVFFDDEEKKEIIICHELDFIDFYRNN